MLWKSHFCGGLQLFLNARQPTTSNIHKLNLNYGNIMKKLRMDYGILYLY